MSRAELVTGDPELAAIRWQVFNTNYGVKLGDLSRRRKMGLLIQSATPWAASFDQLEGDAGYREFITHREALDYALSNGAAE